ncbi:hypothetical protein DPQ33_01565 [Oceanidesulfovibrio indonesiensis]|uniref:Uncharacterized protein n=1 Tax=Oceanidesulfovibrio indonesiensis TaxID=54767 RepID=A0A7M3MJF3_9BACT|nr:hypothetical protein DPQ33_01565 [Oceanidesulfovibrio indonesiensis]
MGHDSPSSSARAPRRIHFVSVLRLMPAAADAPSSESPRSRLAPRISMTSGVSLPCRPRPLPASVRFDFVVPPVFGAMFNLPG